MMLLWAVAGVPLGVYNIVEEMNVALRVQPQILTFLSLVTWAQCFYYRKVGTPIQQLSKGPWMLMLTRKITLAKSFTCRLYRCSGPHSRDLRRHRSGTGLRPASSSKTRLGMAAYLNGGSQCLSAGRWRAEALLGHLRSPNRARNQLYLCRDRRCWRPVLSRVCVYVSLVYVCLSGEDGETNSQQKNKRLVCKSSIDILGMVIYGTELTLWIGVFICGIVFNFVPWIEKRSKERKSRAQEQEERQHGDISRHEMPSSTSVFRTASGSDVVTRRVPHHGSSSLGAE